MHQGGPYIQYDCCPYTKRRRHTDRQADRHTHTRGRRPDGDGGKVWSDAATNQRLPRTAGKHQTWGGARRHPPLETSKGAGSYRHLALRLPAPRTVREDLSVVLSPPHSDTWLPQPQETDPPREAWVLEGRVTSSVRSNDRPQRWWHS